MRCPSQLTLQSYFDGELRESESEKIFDHLCACDECSRVIGVLQSVDSVFVDQGECAPSIELRDQIFSSVDSLLEEREALHRVKEESLDKFSEVINRSPIEIDFKVLVPIFKYAAAMVAVVALLNLPVLKKSSFELTSMDDETVVTEESTDDELYIDRNEESYDE